MTKFEPAPVPVTGRHAIVPIRHTFWVSRRLLPVSFQGVIHDNFLAWYQQYMGNMETTTTNALHIDYATKKAIIRAIMRRRFANQCAGLVYASRTVVPAFRTF